MGVVPTRIYLEQQSDGADNPLYVAWTGSPGRIGLDRVIVCESYRESYRETNLQAWLEGC